MRFLDRLTASSSAYTANLDEPTLANIGVVRSTKDSPCTVFSCPTTVCKRTMLIAVLQAHSMLVLGSLDVFEIAIETNVGKRYRSRHGIE
jgi:hypothetical protein